MSRPLPPPDPAHGILGPPGSAEAIRRARSRTDQGFRDSIRIRTVPALPSGVDPAWLPPEVFRPLGSRRTLICGTGPLVDTVHGEVTYACTRFGGEVVQDTQAQGARSCTWCCSWPRTARRGEPEKARGRGVRAGADGRRHTGHRRRSGRAAARAVPPGPARRGRLRAGPPREVHRPALAGGCWTTGTTWPCTR